jgi:hypothetical protein
MAKDPMVI